MRIFVRFAYGFGVVFLKKATKSEKNRQKASGKQRLRKMGKQINLPTKQQMKAQNKILN